ncbi:ribosomal protein S18 (macronuclear) [Tetrahymena thermophila SB210]|uniref:Ribosomal protein S18 n=1 Tax=Tetrahymena thermophila (strain SB210) TaxID=312017 RepID=Q23K82_TETTS|nr:ribosomal protein S18 [Tetrahymena thermophila SB210]EAR96961.2 ribosomal protein S18 [Tetrahymena thermophila SB210]6Z1P_Br Chain Br, Ribosomal protein S18 [Tetrahymena thermophila SB210]|eukprot:XP_001017206.2 ribosomal protein S18 [Tetrahymena thermophila SB210]
MQVFINKNLNLQQVSRLFKLRAHSFSTSEQLRIKNLNALKHELKNNPLFDRAFPEYKGKKPETTVVKKQEELDFIRSLGLKERINKNISLEEAEHQNFKQFVEGFRSPSGPLKYMDHEEKQKINFLIDQKLEELEATGLTREEILYDNPTHTGLPLNQDPFFQYIKNNYTAREVLLKPGEEYTVQKIIDLALRQDIGADPSQSAAKLKNQKVYHASKMGLPSSRKNPNAFDNTSYLGATSSTSEHYIKELVRPDRKNHEIPLTKAQTRKQSIRKINYFDIHWRNTELITQFVNNSGCIKNKIQNRLTRPQQKKIARTIRLSREMLLMPFRGYIKPSDKKSLTTLQEDVENTVRTAINIETGHIYIKGSVNEYRNVTKEFENLNDNFDAKRAEQSKDYVIDGNSQKLETTEELTLLEARMHSAQLKEKQLKDLGVDTQAIREKYQASPKNPQLTIDNILSIQTKQYIYPPEFEQLDKKNQDQFKESFSKFQEKINQVPVDKFASLLVHEKATDATEFSNKIQESDISLQESLEYVNQIRSRGGLSTPLKI